MQNKTIMRRALLVCGMMLAALSLWVGSPAAPATAATITIAKARALPTSSAVSVTGTVTSITGTLYIQDASGGVRVSYTGSGSAPTLAEGDIVTVTGTISNSGIQRSISATDITKTGSTTPITPLVIDSKDGDKHLGQLVKMSVTVVSARSYQSTIFVTNSTKKNSKGVTVINPNRGLVIFFNTLGLPYYPIHGDKACMTGIVDLASSGYDRYPQRYFPAIYPRRASDLVEAAC